MFQESPSGSIGSAEIAQPLLSNVAVASYRP